MKKLFLFFILIILIIGGCAVGKSLDSAPDLSELKKGVTQDKVREVLGKPAKVDSLGNEIYKVRKGKASVGRAVGHTFLDFCTLGLWEIAGSDAEERRYRKIAVLYDKNGRLEAILEEIEYKFSKVALPLLRKEWEKTRKDNKYVLIFYAKESGWFFVDKENINCSFKNKYIKIYIKTIFSVSAIKKEITQSRNPFKKIPLFKLQTVFFDPESNTYAIRSVNIYDSEGKILLSLKNDEKHDWCEMYPDSIIKNVYNALSFYCVNKYLKEFRDYKEPSLGI